MFVSSLVGRGYRLRQIDELEVVGAYEKLRRAAVRRREMAAVMLFAVCGRALRLRASQRGRLLQGAGQEEGHRTPCNAEIIAHTFFGSWMPWAIRVNRKTPYPKFSESAECGRNKNTGKNAGAFGLFAGGGFGGVGAGGLEAVANPGFGEDVFWLGGVGFEFFAELVDYDAEIFGFFAVVGAPDSLEQAAVREGLALTGDEVF